MTYKDKTFCQSGDKDSKKCKECYRYFDSVAYRKFCEQRGFKVPVAFFEKKPCETEKEQEK